MQLAALAAADLRLKRGREEERILRQLQGLRAGIRRVRGDDDAGVLELGGEVHVQPIAAIVKAFERHLAADGRQSGAGHRCYGPSLAKQRALQGDDDDRKSTCLNSSHEWISYAVF